MRRGVFAHAVADHRGRFQPPRHPQLRLCELHGKKGRQRERGLFQQRGGSRFLAHGRHQRGAKVERRVARQQLQALINRVAEDSFAAVQVGAHVRVLRAATGKHEGHAARLLAAGVRVDALRVVGREGHHRIGRVTRDQDAALSHRLATNLQRISCVGEIDGRMVLQVLGEACRDAVERRRGLGRKKQQLVRTRSARGLPGRRFFDDDVCVGATDAERADAGAARHAGPRCPGFQRRVHDEWAGVEITRRVRRAEVQRGRQLAVLQCHRHLDETRHAGRSVGVADVALD